MKIQLLEKTHNRKNFTCEEDSLTGYIRKQVSQDIRKRLATCFVAIDKEQNVIGYYTLTSESPGRKLIPGKYIKQIPINYNAPVILLGRLARDISSKGTGLGEHLLLDALFRSYKLSNETTMRKLFSHQRMFISGVPSVGDSIEEQTLIRKLYRLELKK